MGQLVVTEFVSLDGVMDAPGGGDHHAAGWTFSDVAFDEAAYEIKGREQEQASALLMGRVTYEEFAPVWPSMTEFAVYNAMPKYVVSSTLRDPEWEHTSVLPDLDAVAALKQREPGEIHLHASATLAQGLAAADLVDRYHLLVFPVLLGAGKRLFATDEARQQLRLVEHAACGNGVTLGVYDVVR